MFVRLFRAAVVASVEILLFISKDRPDCGMKLSTALLLLGSASAQLLESLIDDSNPQVQLDYGLFKGNADFDNVYSFLGMPFANAGRLENPQLISAADKLSGVQDATKYGKACPQAELVASPVSADNAELGALLAAVEELAFAPISNQGEDCLTINVQIPKGINSTAGLPVVNWIFGGGYELGSSASLGLELTAVEVYFTPRVVISSVLTEPGGHLSRCSYRSAFDRDGTAGDICFCKVCYRFA